MIALYNIDPQKKYYNNAVEWGEKHKWEKIILNRITTISTDFNMMGEKAAELI